MNSELLSRIAETLYWTGRYVERADMTARLLLARMSAPDELGDRKSVV